VGASLVKSLKAVKQRVWLPPLKEIDSGCVEIPSVVGMLCDPNHVFEEVKITVPFIARVVVHPQIGKHVKQMRSAWAANSRMIREEGAK
jgi:hypothetical protein